MTTVPRTNCYGVLTFMHVQISNMYVCRQAVRNTAYLLLQHKKASFHLCVSCHKWPKSYTTELLQEKGSISAASSCSDNLPNIFLVLSKCQLQISEDVRRTKVNTTVNYCTDERLWLLYIMENLESTEWNQLYWLVSSAVQ